MVLDAPIGRSFENFAFQEFISENFPSLDSRKQILSPIQRSELQAVESAFFKALYNLNENPEVTSTIGGSEFMFTREWMEALKKKHLSANLASAEENLRNLKTAVTVASESSNVDVRVVGGIFFFLFEQAWLLNSHLLIIELEKTSISKPFLIWSNFR